jgi:archaeosine synthase beta-subunit
MGHDSSAGSSKSRRNSTPLLAPELLADYPAAPQERDRWIVARRGARAAVTAETSQSAWVEEERSASGTMVAVTTLLLTNRECPWRCLMCDLWRHTLTERVAPGLIPHQIRSALASRNIAPRPAGIHHLKLYNSGSFFDPGAIPEVDDADIARLADCFAHVIVESHPALIGDRCWRFRDLLSGSLEVAMGLETAHPEVLDRLNKRITLDQFAHAAARLRSEGVALRVFLLVHPPFLTDPATASAWLQRSIDYAFGCGANVVSLIPSRVGNGALDALQSAGAFAQPSLQDLEAGLDYGVSLRRGRVFADLWDLQRFSQCERCYNSRQTRLARINHTQTSRAQVVCTCRTMGDECRKPGGTGHR